MAHRLLYVMLHPYHPFLRLQKPAWAIRSFTLLCRVSGKTDTVNHTHKTIHSKGFDKESLIISLIAWLRLSEAKWCFLTLMIQLLHNNRGTELCPFTVCLLLILVYLLSWQISHIGRQLFIHNKGLYKLSSMMEEMSQCRHYGGLLGTEELVQWRIACPLNKTQGHKHQLNL